MDSSALDKVFRKGFSKPFRGGIPENCRRFAFRGGGYKAMPAEQGGHFWLESAMQVAGPMAALTDDLVRYVHVIGATQVLKSIVGDAWVVYCVEHVQLPMLVLFEDDPKADLYCGLRLMETLRHHPHISKMLADSMKESRHNVTGTWIKTLTSELLVAGLNDGNVSSLSWPLIWVSEAWQHGSDGLLEKAFKRSDRYAETCKVLNESQAAMAGTDLHRAVQKAHQVPLTWKCLACDGVQTWEWQHWAFKRPDDFIPRERKTISTASIGGETAIVTHEPPKPGSYGGMKWIAEEANTHSVEERARSAYWECLHCGHHIHDTREERKQLTRSYVQDYRITLASGATIAPKQVAFTIPFESAWDNRFEKTVANYLLAKNAKAQGNAVPLQDWFMAERAMFYDPRLSQAQINILSSNYDVSGGIPDEVCRVGGVDCQQGEVEKMTGKFWYVFRAVDKKGDLYQIARGYAESWAELIALQKQHKIPNENLAIDGGQYLHEILDRAAANFELVEKDILNTRTGKPTGKKLTVRSVWKVFRGNGTRKSFAHGSGPERKFRSFSMPSYYQRQIVADGNPAMLNIPVYEWSNLSVKDHLHNLMMGSPTTPKFVSLSREQLTDTAQAKEIGDLAYSKQMQNEYRTRERGQDKWVQATPNVHYRDCESECVVLFDMGGYLGLPAAADTTEV